MQNTREVLISISSLEEPKHSKKILCLVHFSMFKGARAQKFWVESTCTLKYDLGKSLTKEM